MEQDKPTEFERDIADITSELPSTLQYDVQLKDTKPDGSKTDITWAFYVDRSRVLTAVTELLAMKEKYRDEGDWDGDIIIRSSRAIVTPQYHGGQHEEDGADSSSRRLRSVPGPGEHLGNRGLDRPTAELEELLKGRPIYRTYSVGDDEPEGPGFG